MSEATAPRDLGDGLVLRWATAADVARIAHLNAHVFRNKEEDEPNEFMVGQTQALMSGDNPLVGADDFALVEDTKSGAAIASLCLMWQVWEYDGVPFTVGRPEIVGSDPRYRQRGLIRALFEALHARSAAQGHLAQGITGIEYFYRQFGYEYALDLDGHRTVYDATIPEVPKDDPAPYRLRPATLDELPFLTALYDQRRAGYLVSNAVPEPFWRYALAPPAGDHPITWNVQAIVDGSGVPCGFVRLSRKRWQGYVAIWDIAVGQGVSMRAVALPVLRALREIGAALPLAQDKQAPKPFAGLNLVLGRQHPFYDVLGEKVAPGYTPPYAWYVRVADLPGFLRHIAPVLERRLAASSLAGHSGELRLDFFRGGLRLTFTGGKLTAVEPWRRPVWGDQPRATFPPLVFLQLLFGRRSLAELRESFPDVSTDDDAAPLLNILFPQGLSRVMWVE